MGDPFVPEADALDRQREVEPSPASEGERPALVYPDHHRVEVPEADLLEQSQPVAGEDDDWRPVDDGMDVD